MNTQKYHLHDGKKGAALAVRVTPRSSRNEIAEVRDDGTVRVRLKAALVEGQANEALVTFLSDVLDIQPTKIEIVAGATGRDKLISILDLDSDTVHERIIQYLGKS
jgi:hypothetical protein